VAQASCRQDLLQNLTDEHKGQPYGACRRTAEFEILKTNILGNWSTNGLVCFSPVFLFGELFSAEKLASSPESRSLEKPLSGAPFSSDSENWKEKFQGIWLRHPIVSI
jgi:hypothetical protein